MLVKSISSFRLFFFGGHIGDEFVFDFRFGFQPFPCLRGAEHLVLRFQGKAELVIHKPASIGFKDIFLKDGIEDAHLHGHAVADIHGIVGVGIDDGLLKRAHDIFKAGLFLLHFQEVLEVAGGKFQFLRGDKIRYVVQVFHPG